MLKLYSPVFDFIYGDYFSLQTILNHHHRTLSWSTSSTPSKPTIKLEIKPQTLTDKTVKLSALPRPETQKRFLSSLLLWWVETYREGTQEERGTLVVVVWCFSCVIHFLSERCLDNSLIASSIFWMAWEKKKKKKQFINIMMMFVGLKENKLGAPVISKHVPKHI